MAPEDGPGRNDPRDLRTMRFRSVFWMYAGLTVVWLGVFAIRPSWPWGIAAGLGVLVTIYFGIRDRRARSGD
ncbi:hypothetical protein NBM05_02110 [Rothia sp. AR01]|uniref:Uncharacterized protein n=1 Tax=Rothia santali TaxID=2949643 RepID=A0A9X2KHF5_9MICC|nr:hypothetical protein [Rothia santali]MCP3424855.1 hypothetical protein [Rothia santali]